MEFIPDATQDQLDKASDKAAALRYPGEYRMKETDAAARNAPKGANTKQEGDKLLRGMGADREIWDMENKVKYVEPSIRDDKYLVEIAAKMRRRGEVFDTAGVIKHFKDKDRSKPNKEGKKRAVIAGVEEETLSTTQNNEWSDAALIWVWSSEGKFYSHVPKMSRFHHSSFVAGGDVQGAGQWIVKDGNLSKINPMSGHYMPTLSHLHKSVLAMAAAWQKETTILLWDKTDKKWADVPVVDFGNEPAGGGRYNVHPNAP